MFAKTSLLQEFFNLIKNIVAENAQGKLLTEEKKGFQ